MDLYIERDPHQQGFGDTAFVNGACPITIDTTQAIAQRVFVMLRTFEGEWYLNQGVGIPYTQQILGHKISKSRVDRILQEKILNERGVADITSFTSSVNGQRVYEARFTIRTIDGEEVTETFTLDI